MTFAHPRLLWLLLVVPPAMAVFYWWSWRARQNLMTRFIRARLLEGLVAGVSPARRKIRAASLVLAVAALIIALARPQWGYHLTQVQQRGLDIVVAVDTSKSMLAEDIAPDRLDRAKLSVLDLMHQARSDRMGLVAFAGNAFLACPLTFDDSAFSQSLEALDVNTIPEGGTALAAAIREALKAFKKGDNYKVLVLFTDGEDHDSGALAEAKKAAAAGLRIFTVGIGSPQGALLRIKDANGQSDYIRDENGNVVKSHLNASLLQQIAGAARGFYLPLQGAHTMDTLYQRGLAPLPKTESKERWLRQPRERYGWPLTAAIALLVFEMLFSDRKAPRKTRPDSESNTAGPGSGPAGSSREPASGTVRTATIATTIAAAFFILPLSARGSPSSALHEYKAGHYSEALKDYENALQKKSDDLRLHFNAGAAAYRNGDFNEAARHFDKALTSPDLNLQEKAYYNLGNTLYRLGQENPNPQKKSQSWEQSLKQFQNSLELNTNDADAEFNYQFVKKQLERLKKQQQQQNQGNRNQKQNQDQKQQKQPQNQNQQQQRQQQQQSGKQQQKQQQQQQQQQQQKQQQQQQQKQQQQQESQQARKQEEKQDETRQQQAENEKRAGQKPPEPQPGRKSSKQEKQEPRQQRAYAAGEMSPQEARQLLDSQKQDEQMLPMSRKQAPSAEEGPIQDW